MKLNLIAILISVIIFSINCSGDRAVVDPIATENETTNSANLSETPNPEYPPDYGDDEFTPPFMIIMSYNVIGDTSGNNRIITVGTFITDFYGRPYTSPGIEINFEIIPDSIATINPVAYTNEWGWASSKLVYPPVYAFEEIQLIASCHWTADTVTLLLPLISPQLELNADPEMLWVEQAGTFDTSIVGCRLSDGVDNYISGGRIVFVPLVAGEICGPTSVYTDDHGWAHTQYRIRYEDIPDGHNDPNSIYTGVRATLFGYPDMEEEISLYCNRP